MILSGRVNRSGSLTAGLIFSAYLFFFHDIVYNFLFYDPVLRASRDVFYSGRTSPLLAALLAAVIAGEVYAFYVRSGSPDTDDSAGSGFFVLWIFHTVIAVIMTITALMAMGMGLDDYPVVSALFLFAAVIKELVILGIIAAGTKKKRSPKELLAADIFFALFYSVAYTVVIGNILNPAGYNNYLFVSWYSRPLFFMNLFIVILLFLIFYLPLLLPYFVSERHDTPLTRASLILSIILAGAGALTPLFDGEYSLNRALENPAEAEMLFLKGRHMKEVPPEIGRLVNLKVLHLGFNDLKSLPDSMGRLKKLEWINLEGNAFRQIPEVLLKLPSLREMDIHYNRITAFPKNLKPLEKMTEIKAHMNMMSAEEKKRIRGRLGRRVELQ